MTRCPREQQQTADKKRVGTRAQVFATDSVHARCSFRSAHMGGARPLGDGVFLVASGQDGTGLEASLLATSSLLVCSSVGV